MISTIVEFFKREKIYVLLLFFLAIVFSVSLLRVEETASDSVAYQEFRQAEKHFEHQLRSTESIEGLFRQRPYLKIYFNSLLLIVLSVFSLGLFIDFLLISRPSFREKIFRRAPPDNVDWRFSMLVKVIILFLASGYVLSFVISVIKKKWLPEIPMNFLILLHTLVMDFLVFYYISCFVRRNGGSWKDLGFRLPDGSFIREISIGIGGYLAILPVFIAILCILIVLTEFFSYEPPTHPLVTVFLEEETRAPWVVGFSLFLAAMIGPCLEEVFFRGFCYPIFKRFWGTGMGMVASSVLFALIHENIFAFFPIFILGMGLAFLYEKRRSIVGPMVLHMTHNTIFMTYFFAAKQVVATEASTSTVASSLWGMILCLFRP